MKGQGGARGGPPLARWLLALVRGRGSEFVVGDVWERHAEDLAGGMDRRAAERRLRRQAWRTVRGWWSPAAVARRWGGGEHGTGGHTVGGWIGDVRTACRGLVRRPRFALAVLLTMGLGIGATTTIFSVVDGVLFRPLPYEEPEPIVAVGTTFPGREWRDEAAGLQHLAGTSVLNWLDFRDRVTSLEDLGAVEYASMLLPDEGNGPELINAARVSPEFLRALRVEPVLGRSFLPEEHRAGGPQSVLLSHATWVRRFGADPAVLGTPLRRVSDAVVVVGVLPPEFRAPEVFFAAGSRPELWLPLQPDHMRYAARGRRSLNLVARLAPGATLHVAREELQGVADRLAVEHPDGNVYPDGTHFGAGTNLLHAQTVGSTADALSLFLGAAVLLLLIAALNSATLLLARAVDRVQEMGVRVALGARPTRIVRLVLTESVVLSAVGGVLGVALAHGGVSLFRAFAPASIPRLDAVAVDGRVLLTATAASLVAGLAAGMLPALRQSARLPADRIRTGSGRTASGGEAGVRSALVVGQTALAVVLLGGAGLLIGSFHEIRTVDPGFEPEGLTTFRVGVKRPGAPPDQPDWQAWDLMLEEAGKIPGVSAVAATSNPPFQDPWWAPWIQLAGDPPEHRRQGISGYLVTPDYLETVGTRLLEGRPLGPQDGPDGPWVMLVNETFVREHLEGGPAVGVQVAMPERERTVEIVGVVEDVVQARADEPSRPAVYVPYTQDSMPFAQVVVKSDLPLETLVPEIRRAVLRFSRVVPAVDVSTVEARMAATRTAPRFQAALVGTFAVVALLLAAAGLYASLSHAVGRRRRELGIRLAIGAERHGLLRAVVSDGMKLSGTGIAIGLVAAWWGSRLLDGFLWGVEPGDPAILAGGALVLGLVALIACLRPAWSATRVDPVEVLGAE